jgi:hypothetical protein
MLATSTGEAPSGNLGISPCFLSRCAGLVLRARLPLEAQTSRKPLSTGLSSVLCGTALCAAHCKQWVQAEWVLHRMPSSLSLDCGFEQRLDAQGDCSPSVGSETSRVLKAPRSQKALHNRSPDPARPAARPLGTWHPLDSLARTSSATRGSCAGFGANASIKIIPSALWCSCLGCPSDDTLLRSEGSGRCGQKKKLAEGRVRGWAHIFGGQIIYTDWAGRN